MFFSYRRDDSRDTAKDLAAYVSRILPQEYIFIDVRSIDPGEDFPQRLRNAIVASDLVFCLIGPLWETLKGENGKPRINEVDDFVRMEIEQAISHRKQVIPLLIDRKQMPDPAQLPSSIRDLVSRNATVGTSRLPGELVNPAIRSEHIGLLPYDTVASVLMTEPSISELAPNLRRKESSLLSRCEFHDYEDLVGIVDLSSGNDGSHFICFTTAGIHHRNTGGGGATTFIPYYHVKQSEFRSSAVWLNGRGLSLVGTSEKRAYRLVEQLLANRRRH